MSAQAGATVPWGGRLRVMGLAAALAAAAGAAAAPVVELDQMERITNDTSAPPPPDQLGQWQSLPDIRTQTGAVWYRAPFRGPPDAPRGPAWAVYLPYLYDGGQIWVNGQLVADVPITTSARHVRWERPWLLPLPSSLLRPNDNVLEIHAAPAVTDLLQRIPRVRIGPLAELQPESDRRLFWVRTMPQITVVVCLLVAGFVLYIWWRRRSEVLYGLFGLATALWGVRTLTFVIESAPPDAWIWWRVTYLATTGGFIVVMALFALRLAGSRRRGIENALVLYAIAGPIWLITRHGDGEGMVNRLWSGGLIPIGMAIIGVSIWHVTRQRNLAAAAMPAALVIAAIAGVHDYLLAWDTGALARVLGGWATERIFLLHHGANILLLTMGCLLTARFIHALSTLEELNQTLELRVADRERHLAENYARLASMQQQHAAAEERQLIMREIHDGLGSRLFTSLSRVERGDMDRVQIARSLRECIADMRLALDALAPDNEDFRTAVGNFLFRWQAHLEEAHISTDWTIDVRDDALRLPAPVALQLLRIAQEALTNVLRHAHAAHVHVLLRQHEDSLELEIVDDGGGSMPSANGSGRGVQNMRARAQRLGGCFEFKSGDDGTRVFVRVPVTE